MLTAYKFRLYPNNEQKETFSKYVKKEEHEDFQPRNEKLPVNIDKELISELAGEK